MAATQIKKPYIELIEIQFKLRKKIDKEVR